MAEYISKEKAILALLEKGQHSKRYKIGKTWELNFDEIREAIKAIPPADVVPRKDYESMERTVDKLNKALAERKHGEWVGYPECLKYMNAYSDDHIVCSACEECFSILDNDCERFNFCPNCGADMRAEEGE